MWFGSKGSADVLSCESCNRQVNDFESRTMVRGVVASAAWCCCSSFTRRNLVAVLACDVPPDERSEVGAEDFAQGSFALPWFAARHVNVVSRKFSQKNFCFVLTCRFALAASSRVSGMTRHARFSPALLFPACLLRCGHAACCLAGRAIANALDLCTTTTREVAMSSVYPITILIRHSDAEPGCFFANFVAHSGKEAFQFLRAHHAQIYYYTYDGIGWFWFAETGR